MWLKKCQFIPIVVVVGRMVDVIRGILDVVIRYGHYIVIHLYFRARITTYYFYNAVPKGTLLIRNWLFKFGVSLQFPRSTSYNLLSSVPGVQPLPHLAQLGTATVDHFFLPKASEGSCTRTSTWRLRHMQGKPVPITSKFMLNSWSVVTVDAVEAFKGFGGNCEQWC